MLKMEGGDVDWTLYEKKRLVNESERESERVRESVRMWRGQ